MTEDDKGIAEAEKQLDEIRADEEKKKADAKTKIPQQANLKPQLLDAKDFEEKLFLKHTVEYCETIKVGDNYVKSGRTTELNASIISQKDSDLEELDKKASELIQKCIKRDFEQFAQKHTTPQNTTPQSIAQHNAVPKPAQNEERIPQLDAEEIEALEWSPMKQNKAGQWAFQTEPDGSPRFEAKALIAVLKKDGSIQGNKKYTTIGNWKYCLSGDKFIQRYPA